MNALLVDDDYFVVTALEKKIDWTSLRIDGVYTANNVAQAREIIKQQEIHILISDIEMPQGSGLELLAWIREEKYSVQTIFLTNYADFNYAQKAIELQSFEYFLKPIEFDKLMLIIQKAVAKANEQRHAAKAQQEGYFWQKNQSKIVEHFWRKLASCSSSVPMRPAAIAHAVHEQHLDYRMTDLCQPLLLNLFPYDGSMGKEEKDLFDFALLNVLGELFRHPAFAVETMLEHSPRNWIAVLKWTQPPDARLIEELCASFIHQANRALKCDACCNVAPAGELGGIGAILKQLLDMNEAVTKSRNRILHVSRDRLTEDAAYAPPDLALLDELLNQNDPAAFLSETSRYMRSMLSTAVLSRFRLDIVQLVYAFLKNKGIAVHQLYAGKIHDQLLMQSLNSLEDMEEYLRYLVNTAMQYRHSAAEPTSVVEAVKQFIQSHYGHDLTRNALAETVYLHPDYLARLFKKETGVSLGSYVIQTRISAAKLLLETSRHSVYAIASKVGYDNYSYFSKLFKQEVGCSPNEYKKVKQ
ncbi:response regulator transcription factor [Paenibacillus methanolicus]|uniref:Two-component system response regulator YesN n=1 Tax=Paenibacillus methanolicus TaxID=582686 RepID=A0A5S5CFL4_9BACL|nr:response regulator [Paenibacillus methanolicus]TYP78174.1 two-component system response regulator YesN [Paenibacillus methanolicus]